MGILYIVSAEEAAGKTAICAGLARNLLDSGKKVGYLKPQVAARDGSDSDLAFMKNILGASDVVNAPDVIQGRDTVLVEAMLGQKADDPLSQDTYGAAKEMKAGVIAVESYPGDASKYADVYRGFGENLTGIIINKVPESQLKNAGADIKDRFEKAGIKVLGIIPENRTLLAISVGELAESLNARILNDPEKTEELLENFMLGAMVVDSGLDYFGRKDKKAAIVRQDRPDMQLAALETPTKCLVLTGSSEPPVYNVQQKAENRGIPVITTETSAGDVVEALENLLSKSRMNQEKKLKTLADIIKQNLDIKTLA